jgi:drug/metabolite transporter (DMT)-like permease
MNRVYVWLYIAVAVLVALSANYISAIWAGKESKFSSPWLLAIIVAPFVFITFGLVVSKLGVAIGSGTTDSLLTISAITMGLFLFHERNTISIYQYFGIALAVGGIVLIKMPKPCFSRNFDRNL